MNVILLNGTPARNSRTLAGLDFVSQCFEKTGNESNVIDLLDLQLPINDPNFHKDASLHPALSVRDFAEHIKIADVVVLGTPLYHGSFSGLLKMSLDSLDWNAFAGKTVILLSNSSSERAASQAANELVVVARTLQGSIHNSLIGTCSSDYELIDGVSTLTNEDVKQRIEKVVASITQ